MTDAETILRRLLDEIFKDKRYTAKITAIAADGSNYTSLLYRITLRIKDDVKLFAKIANVNAKIRGVIQADHIYKTERYVYMHLSKVYDKLQDKYSIPKNEKYKFPKYYGSAYELGKEAVIMEDLVESGYKTYNRFKALDWEHASKIMETLAKFHALSFAFEKDDPEGYQDTLEKLKVKQSGEEEMSNGVWSKMIRSVLQVTQEQYRERLIKFLENSKSMFYKYNRPLGRTVIIHGDYRVSNLLFKSTDNGLEAMPVDYQMVRAGCPGADIIYSIFMASEQTFRRRYCDKLLDHYFDHLTIALDKMDIDVNDVYPRKVFDMEFKEILPYGLLIGVIVLPLITVEAENAPTMGGDNDIASMVVKPNQLFIERFSGIVEDYIEWGIL